MSIHTGFIPDDLVGKATIMQRPMVDYDHNGDALPAGNFDGQWFIMKYVYRDDKRDSVRAVYLWPDGIWRNGAANCPDAPSHLRWPRGRGAYYLSEREAREVLDKQVQHG